MNNIMKTARLDLALVRPYAKRIIVVTLAMPLLYTLLNNNLFSGLSFSMCMTAILSSYTFSISEKNGMERLYGILPVSRKELVLGRYLFTLLMGLFMLLFSTVAGAVILLAKGAPLTSADVYFSALTGIILFISYISVTLPGYYKYGALKAKLFMYIPLAGYFLVFFIVGSHPKAAVLFSAVGKHPSLTAAVMLLLSFALLLCSILLSAKILKNKEIE